MVDFLVCYGHAVCLAEENTILRKIRKLIIEPIQAPILPAPGRGFTYGKCQLQNQKASFCFMLQIPQILFWVCFLLKYMDPIYYFFPSYKGFWEENEKQNNSYDQCGMFKKNKVHPR